MSDNSSKKLHSILDAHHSLTDYSENSATKSDETNDQDPINRIEYNAESHLNTFTPTYSTITPDMEKDIVQDLVEHVLWVKGGDFAGSTVECATITESNEGSNETVFENRLKYWQGYLKDQKRIGDKIMQATGKDRCELLVNRNEEYRKVQQCKRIIDIAERLSPSRLINRQPVKLREIPCRPDVYETLPYTEQHGRSHFTFAEMPVICLQEQGIDKCAARKNGWLNSDYLGARITTTHHQLERVIKKHYPHTKHLEVIGEKITPPAPKEEPKLEEIPNSVEFQVKGVWFKGKEKTHEYVVSIDDEILDAEERHSSDLNYFFCFEADPFVKSTKTITIRNRGWNSVHVEWYQQKERRPKCIRNLNPIHPAFYFNKNMIRILPGSKNTIEFTFCCKEFGIYEELWEMKLIPEFFNKKSKIWIQLFGHCRVDPHRRIAFNEIKDSLSERAARQIAEEVIYEVSSYATPDHFPRKPYSTQFTQAELFAIINPHINFNAASIEALQDIYSELVLEKDSTRAEWNLDLNEIKNVILEIPDEQLRREYYAKYAGLINTMKQKPIIFNPNYEDQMFLLVKGVLIAMADKMEAMIYRLEENMKSTQYDLSFDEVLVTNSKPIKRPIIKKDDGIDGDDNNTKICCVVKSDFVKDRKEEAFKDSLYIQIYGLLCLAVEEVASVVEGMENLL